MSVVTRFNSSAVFDSSGLPFNADAFQQSNPIIISGKTYYQLIKYYRGGLSGTPIAQYVLTYDGEANISSAVVTLL